MSSIKLLVPVIIIQVAGYTSGLKIPHSASYTLEAQRILQRHNIYRQCHSASPLELDENLSAKAQMCANSFATNHSKSKDSGTNLFSDYSDVKVDSTSHLENNFLLPDLFGVHAVDQWYREQLEYPEWTPSNFSQLIWKSSKKLGVGIAQAHDGQIFLCCKYEPVGNVPGFFKDNVVYSTNLSDENIENCLQSQLLHPTEYAELLKNINRPPTYFLQLQVDTNIGNNNTGATNVSINLGPGAAEHAEGQEAGGAVGAHTETLNISSMVNCTGPHCNRTSNDTRPLLNALKKELRTVVTESSKETHKLVKIVIVICIVIMIILIIALIVVIVILCKILSMCKEECCSTGPETPCGPSNFSKSLAAGTSVPQSLQSYM